MNVASSAGGAVSITDNLLGVDFNPAVGQISAFPFGLGGYANVNIVAAFSNDPGNVNGASLQVTTIASRDSTPLGTPPTLTIEASDEGYFIPGGGGLDLRSLGGGTVTNEPGANAIDFQSWGDPGNTLFAHAVASPLQGGGGASYSFGPTHTPFAAAIYSLTNTTHVTLTTPGAISNFSGTTVVVPEPATIGLLGLAGTALLRRRR